jgi:predicted restriction endonuclease
MPPDKYGEDWSRDEMILALYLYCQIPFSKTKANNPDVTKLAAILGRTPASVARKLGNFGSFDPLLAKQGISGLKHTSKADRAIWEEFHHRWEALVELSSDLLHSLTQPSAGNEKNITALEIGEELERPTGPSERLAPARLRLFQSFFRRAVLAGYDCACCVCGIDIRSLLTASHIKPWSVDESVRTDPENGLCLCAIHDRAFDRGLLAVSEELRVILAKSVLSSTQPFVRVTLADFQERPLRMPKRFAPRHELLAWHRGNLFDRPEALGANFLD